MSWIDCRPKKVCLNILRVYPRVSFESEAARIFDMLNGGNFNVWKFRFKTSLAFIDLCNIIDGSEEILLSNEDPKVLKEG